MSTKTTRVLMFLFGGIFVTLVAIFSGSGESSATPVDDTLIAIDQFAGTAGTDPAKAIANAQVSAEQIKQQVVADPQAAITDVHTFAMQPTAGQQITEAFTPETPAVTSSEAAPSTPPVPVNPEQLVIDQLPDSLGNMTVGALDPHVSQGVKLVYGQQAVMPPAHDIPKSDTLAGEIDGVRGLFETKIVQPDLNECGKNTDVSEYACAGGMVNANVPGANTPEIAVVPRFGIYLQGIDSQGRPCGGYLAIFAMCNNQIIVSDVVADNLTGRNATVVDLFPLIAHEGRHAEQELDVAAVNGGNMEAFRDLAESNPDAEAEAENNADIGAGVAYGYAILNGQLTEADLQEFLRVIGNAGSNGDPSDPHATGVERQQYVLEGVELARQGKVAPPYKYAIAA